MSYHSTIYSNSCWLIPRPTGVSQTAGPSEPRRGLELGLDEVSPPDLGDVPAAPLDLNDELYRPPEGYQPKYENNATMTFEERLDTDEVKQIRPAIVLSVAIIG